MLIASGKNDVIRDAMKNKKEVRFARIFPICSEKGCEYLRVIPIASLRGGVSSKAVMLETKTRAQLHSRNYLPRQQL